MPIFISLPLVASVSVIGNVSEFDSALYVRKHLCILRLLFRLFFHYLDKALEAAGAVLELLHKHDQRIHGADEQIHRYDKGGIIAEGDPSGIQGNAAGDKDQNIENIGYKGGGGKEFCHGIVSTLGSIHKLFVANLKLIQFPGGICVSLGDPDTGDGAFHRGVDDGVALAAIIKGCFIGLRKWTVTTTRIGTQANTIRVSIQLMLSR